MKGGGWMGNQGYGAEAAQKSKSPIMDANIGQNKCDSGAEYNN